MYTINACMSSIEWSVNLCSYTYYLVIHHVLQLLSTGRNLQAVYFLKSYSQAVSWPQKEDRSNCPISYFGGQAIMTTINTFDINPCGSQFIRRWQLLG